MIGWMLTTIYLAGTGTGILGVTAFHTLRRKYTEHLQHQQGAIQEIQAYEEQPDQIEDDRIVCPHCWEGRHPGQLWPMRSYIPCHEHTNERPGVTEEDHPWREVALHH